jgi:hypothetical protein
MKRAGLSSDVFKLVYTRLIENFRRISPFSFAGMPVYRWSPLILRRLPTRRAGRPQTLVVKVMP